MKLRFPKPRWLLPVAAYAVSLADWRPVPYAAEPRLLRAFHGSGPLAAGAAKVRLAPPLPVVRPPFRYPGFLGTREEDPLQVRAIVLQSGGKTLALVLADLVLVTDDLVRGLESRLGDLRLDGILLVASHTHSSVGGFDAHRAAQVLGLGAFRPDVAEMILTRSEDAVRKAERNLVSVRVRTGEARLEGWAWNRSTPGGAVDDALSVAVLEDRRGDKVATLAVVSGHPTLFPSAVPELSADYPGLAMGELEEEGGVALLLQGAEGDAAAPGQGRAAMQAAARFVAERVGEAVAQASASEDHLGFVEADVSLPPVEVQRVPSFFFRRPLSSLVGPMLPRAARVGLLTLGDLALLTVAGEPTASAAEQMVRGLPAGALAGRKVRVIALAQAYISYIDTPDRVRRGTGESRRAWYGPELLGVVTRGLNAVVKVDRSLP